MWEGEGVVDELSVDECWKLLRQAAVGRIAATAGGQVDIFPVNATAQRPNLYFRTAPGTKLLEMTIHEHVAFEVDGYTSTKAWSVVAKGIATVLEREAEVDAAESLGLVSWVPTPKTVWVRIGDVQVSGRRFKRN